MQNARCFPLMCGQEREEKGGKEAVSSGLAKAREFIWLPPLQKTSLSIYSRVHSEGQREASRSQISDS